MIFFHRRVSSRREDGRVAVGGVSLRSGEFLVRAFPSVKVPACRLGAHWQNLSMGNLHQLVGAEVSSFSCVRGLTATNWREQLEGGPGQWLQVSRGPVDTSAILLRTCHSCLGPCLVTEGHQVSLSLPALTLTVRKLGFWVNCWYLQTGALACCGLRVPG